MSFWAYIHLLQILMLIFLEDLRLEFAMTRYAKARMAWLDSNNELLNEKMH